MNSLGKIIVTGGAGFIGSHLVPRLLSQGNKVLVIDNLHSGRREYVPPDAEYLDLDLGRTDESSVSHVFRTFCPDAVIHLAAIHYIPHCVANPAETFRANVRATEIIVRALSGTPVRKLIAASTADVYPLANRPHQETETPAFNNPYGLSKVLMEEIVAAAARANPNLSCIALRIVNVYGPRDTNPHVIPRIIELLCSTSPKICVGATETTRDFVHVDDVVQAICMALLHDFGSYDVFNVGTGDATSIRRVLEILLQAAGDSRPVVQDKNLLRSYDRPSLTADVTKIRRVMGWHPTVDIEEGLTRLVQQTILATS